MKKITPTIERVLIEAFGEDWRSNVKPLKSKKTGKKKKEGNNK